MHSCGIRIYEGKLDLVWQVRRVNAYEVKMARVRRNSFSARYLWIRKEDAIRLTLVRNSLSENIWHRSWIAIGLMKKVLVQSNLILHIHII